MSASTLFWVIFIIAIWAYDNYRILKKFNEGVAKLEQLQNQNKIEIQEKLESIELTLSALNSDTT